jgi:hypothetical protein
LSDEDEEVEGDGDGALGNTRSDEEMPGLPRPEELELLERWGPGTSTGAGRTGRTGGGLRGALGRRADSAGLKVLMVVSEEELLLLLRRWTASGSRITMVCRGLLGASGPRGCFMGSRVSSTTSGACLATFWRSSSRSSWRAVFMVFSMSWGRREMFRKGSSAVQYSTVQYRSVQYSTVQYST